MDDPANYPPLILWKRVLAHLLFDDAETLLFDLQPGFDQAGSVPCAIWGKLQYHFVFTSMFCPETKKVLDSVHTEIQGLHPAQLDPLLSGKCLVPRNKDLFENPCGIRQVFWLTDLPNNHSFPAGSIRPVDNHGFRPRLQRRDRDGFAPSSLLNPEK
jgi:hypothetical protein